MTKDSGLVSESTLGRVSPSESPPTRSYPAYLSMYPKGSSFEPIAPPVRIMESEKLRRIRRRKEYKESKKFMRVVQYQTSGDDENYNLAAVLESLEPCQNGNSHQASSLVNNGSNAHSNHAGPYHHHQQQQQHQQHSNTSTTTGLGKEGRKDKKVRRNLTRRRSQGGGQAASSSSKATSPRSLEEDSSSSEGTLTKDFEEEDEEEELEDEEEDDKMSSSSLVGGPLSAPGEEEDPLFGKGNKLERGLSKSSENLNQYSSDNLSSFTKVTNKKQKWKKKLAHSVDIPDAPSHSYNHGTGGGGVNNYPYQYSNHHHYHHAKARSGGGPHGKPPLPKGPEHHPPRPDLDLNARDFPPLDPRVVEDMTSPSNGPPWSKQQPALYSVSSSSSSSVVAVSTEEKGGKVVGDLPDVTVRQPPSALHSTTLHLLPDLTAQAVEAERSSCTPPPPSRREDIAIALTEEEYRSQDPSIPLVIFGRGSSAMSDWTSKSEVFEFGFEVNKSLLALSTREEKVKEVKPSHTRPPVRAGDEDDDRHLPLDRMDRAILSFGDSVTNLTVLGDEAPGGSSAGSSPIVVHDSIQLPPYFEEEHVTFNYNEVINYLENAWLESLKDKQPNIRHPVTASSAY